MIRVKAGGGRVTSNKHACASHCVPPVPGERVQEMSMHAHRIAFRQSPQGAPLCTHQACMCIALRSPGSTRDVGSDVDERHTMYASAPRCRRRWRATRSFSICLVKIPSKLIIGLWTLDFGLLGLMEQSSHYYLAEERTKFHCGKHHRKKYVRSGLMVKTTFILLLIDFIAEHRSEQSFRSVPLGVPDNF